MKATFFPKNGSEQKNLLIVSFDIVLHLAGNVEKGDGNGEVGAKWTKMVRLSGWDALFASRYKLKEKNKMVRFAPSTVLQRPRYTQASVRRKQCESAWNIFRHGDDRNDGQ